MTRKIYFLVIKTKSLVSRTVNSIKKQSRDKSKAQALKVRDTKNAFDFQRYSTTNTCVEECLQCNHNDNKNL